METTDAKDLLDDENERYRKFAKRIWSVVDDFRANSYLRVNEYAKPILGLIFLAEANRQAISSADGQKKIESKISVPSVALFDHLLSAPKQELGDALNKAMLAIVSQNEQLNGIETSDYNSQRIGNSDFTPMLQAFSDASAEAGETTFARLYENFLDRFACASGQQSGEFSTPQEIRSLLIELVKPKAGMSFYDPCVGTAGFLREAVAYVERNGGSDSRLSLFGQEINAETLSIARMYLAINGETDADLRHGNTLSDPRHIANDGLKQFDRVVSNPPFSVSIRGFDLAHDPYHRFRYGIPPKGFADYAFIQHMLASLKPDGSMAMVVTHGVLFRGDREGKIRQGVLEDDLVEAVIGLPPALFYGTSISAAILVINKNKPPERFGKVLFINADSDFEREGQRNSLRPEDISRITSTFDEYSDVERFSRVVDLDEIRANSYNLNIPRYADSSPLAGLVTQYDSFAKHTIKELAVEINSAKRGGQFEVKPNAVYIPIAGTHSIDSLDDLTAKHDRYYQVVLNEQAISAYVAQFLGTSVGQHALSILKSGSFVQRLSKSDLEECIIALPSLDIQQEIVTTHQKLSALKEAINNFDRELSLNPSGLTEFKSQLDSMLTVIGELSDADYLRSIIRQGESKTIEFKETFSLNVRHDTGQKDKKIEESSLKTIVAFLNSAGGVLLIGVNDDERITGIDIEVKKFHKNILDKFLLHFKNTMRTRVGEEFYPFINYRIVEAEGHIVLVIECKESERPCFLDERVFYVRTNPATDMLEGTKQYEYIKHRFGS